MQRITTTAKTEPVEHRLSDYKVSDHLIDHTNLSLDLTRQPVRSSAKLTVRSNPDSKDHDAGLVLDFENMQLESLKLNGRLLNADEYILSDNKLIILNVPEGETFTVESETLLGDNPDLFGLYKTEGTVLVKAETEGMRRVLPCKDRPDVLSTYTTTIIAKKDEYPTLLANGVKSASQELPDGAHSVTWHDNVPKPTYLFAMVAGNLDYSATNFLTKSKRELPIEFYVRADATAKCDFAKSILKETMRWDEQTFGLECDLPHHMVAGVDQYASGASEPTGLNLFNTQNLYATQATKTDDDILHVAEVVSHEFLHYWSGDRVTIRDWFNLTFKEGLTTFRSAQFRMKLFGSDIVLVSDGKNLDAKAPRPGTYTAVRSMYTAAAYEKSAAIFRMMMLTMGEEKFYAGMNDFLRMYDGKAVTMEDMFDLLSHYADYAGFPKFMDWFTEPGIPLVEVQETYDVSKHRYTLHVKQSCDTPGYKPRPIPITVGLITSEGKEVVPDTTLMLDEETKDFHFDGMKVRPTPSLLRSFSAPVKLEYDYRTRQLLTLMQHDTNAYNRIEAKNRFIFGLVNDYCEGTDIEISEEVLNTFRAIIKDTTLHPWLLAELLCIPSEEEILSQQENPNFDKVREARATIINSLVTVLHAKLIELYQKTSGEKTQEQQLPEFDMTTAGRRRLKQTCLNYLSAEYPQQIRETAVSQFRLSLDNNMTETINALTLICDLNCPEKENALEQFYQRWKDDPNAINYWFRVQAGSHSTTMDQMRLLASHPAFDITNPNKVYALLNPFIRNPYGFHNQSGEGYKMLTSIILELDQINPAVAARLAENFVSWNKYDTHRQLWMHNQLERLQERASSVNVLEVVKRGLEKGKPKDVSQYYKSVFTWFSIKKDEVVQAAIAAAEAADATLNTTNPPKDHRPH